MGVHTVQLLLHFNQEAVCKLVHAPTTLGVVCRETTQTLHHGQLAWEPGLLLVLWTMYNMRQPSVASIIVFIIVWHYYYFQYQLICIH